MRAALSTHVVPALRQVPPGIALAIVLEAVFLIALAATDGYDVARSHEWFRVVLTFALVVAIFAPLHLALGVDSRRARVATAGVLVLFITLDFAHFETTGTFDYGFLHENVRELATPLGRRIVTAQVRPLEIVLLFALPVLLAFATVRWSARAERTRRSGGAPRLSGRSRVLGISTCVALLAASFAMRASTHEPITSFFASAWRFHAEAHRMDVAIGGARYPFVHEFKTTTAAAGQGIAPDAPKPHVITLFLESWSGIYTDRKNEAGKPYTPVFDAHRREGLAVDHFYGSSIQSSRGRFATMCSLIPLYRGKEFSDLENAPLHCLPHVMNEAGYHSFIYSAADEPGFEKSETFFHHMGFTEVRFEDPKQRGVDPLMWGAGLQDDAYYKRLFAMLDDELVQHPQQPLFAVAINASNHYPFNRNPKHQPEPGLPTKYGRNYVGSLRASDAWLATFFEELDRRPAFKDAIVVLIGDHSFPADEHGIHFNGLGAREESFRTAFSLRWNGHVKPRLVTDHAASQIDYAPTITDLTGIDHKSTFQGRSLLEIGSSAGDRPWVAPMVQPYDGVRLVAVHWPFKLEAHEAAQQEHLYDLSKDMDEEDDLLSNGEGNLDAQQASELVILRDTIERIRRSQAVLHAKRIWPTEKDFNTVSDIAPPEAPLD